MNQDAMNQGQGDGSLAPISIERAEVEDGSALWKKGHALLGARLLGLAALASAALWMASNALDAAQAREEARVSLAAVRDNIFQPFFECALPDTLPERIVDREGLISAIERNASAAGNRYGVRMGRCVDYLVDLHHAVGAMKVPAEAADLHQRLSLSSKQLLDGVRAYAAHLNSPLQDDYVRSLALMDRVATAYLAYEADRQRYVLALLP